MGNDKETPKRGTYAGGRVTITEDEDRLHRAYRSANPQRKGAFMALAELQDKERFVSYESKTPKPRHREGRR